MLVCNSGPGKLLTQDCADQLASLDEDRLMAHKISSLCPPASQLSFKPSYWDVARKTDFTAEIPVRLSSGSPNQLNNYHLPWKTRESSTCGLEWKSMGVTTDNNWQPGHVDTLLHGAVQGLPTLSDWTVMRASRNKSLQTRKQSRGQIEILSEDQTDQSVSIAMYLDTCWIK